MSGITGYYVLDGGRACRASVEAMTEAIAHRGPDGDGSWCDGPIGLGHRLLHATPEARDAVLPREHDGLVITADVRIDNRAELIDELDVRADSRAITDCQLVLAAYQEWGERCPERLVGAFAFAIWDRDEGKLFLARDHVGLRPLYYHRTGDRFAFGSEIKALWTLESVPREINEGRVGEFLSGRMEAGEETFYEGIYRLPAAHSMVVSADGVHTDEYWEPDPAREIDLESDETYAERFCALFTEAVRCRLRSTGPVGATLSGGLDSSSVVATARELLRDDPNAETLRTFSALFDQENTPESDEREFIDAVVDGGGVTSHVVRGDQQNPMAGLDRILWHQESPEVGNNFYLHWNIYQEAERQGVGVVLDGLGGDTTVSHGFGYLPELAASGRWLALAREINGLNERFGRLTSKRRIVRNLLVTPFVPAAVRKWWGRLRGANGVNSFNPVVDPAFASRIDLVERVDGCSVDRIRSERERHRRMLTVDVLLQSVERWNKTARAFSVEPRFPFLDRRLMEFCLALPPEQKIRRGWTRWVLRRAMDGRLPEAVQWRGDKGYLGSSFWQALRDHGSADLEAALFGDGGHLDAYLDMDRVRSAYEAFTAGEDGGLKTLWYPAVLGRWLSSGP